MGEQQAVLHASESRDDNPAFIRRLGKPVRHITIGQSRP
jgi:hypothetical protein